jgi:hypothetical protein
MYSSNRQEQSSPSKLSPTNKSPPEIISDNVHVEEGTSEGTTSIFENVHIPEPSNPFSDVYVLKPSLYGNSITV